MGHLFFNLVQRSSADQEIFFRLPLQPICSPKIGWPARLICHCHAPTSQFLVSLTVPLNVYGGVVHSFTNPAADRLGLPDFARYDAKADARSWREMQALFDEIFAAEA